MGKEILLDLLSLLLTQVRPKDQKGGFSLKDSEVAYYVPVKSKLKHHLNFWKIFVQIPPSRGRRALQMPHYRSIPDDQMPPPPGNFAVAFIVLRKLCM